MRGFEAMPSGLVGARGGHGRQPVSEVPQNSTYQELGATLYDGNNVLTHTVSNGCITVQSAVLQRLQSYDSDHIAAILLQLLGQTTM